MQCSYIRLINIALCTEAIREQAATKVCIRRQVEEVGV